MIVAPPLKTLMSYISDGMDGWVILIRLFNDSNTTTKAPVLLKWPFAIQSKGTSIVNEWSLICHPEVSIPSLSPNLLWKEKITDQSSNIHSSQSYLQKALPATLWHGASSKSHCLILPFTR